LSHKYLCERKGKKEEREERGKPSSFSESIGVSSGPRRGDVCCPDLPVALRVCENVLARGVFAQAVRVRGIGLRGLTAPDGVEQ
jgi:hypothetical protein